MKKLYKIGEGKKLDGVCGGLAEYADIDATLVRLIWVVITLFTVGTGLLAYLICAILMPRKPSNIIDAE